MYEKILQKLRDAREKNSQISDETLTAHATLLATLISTEEQLATLSPKVVLDNIQQNINKIAKEAVQNMPPVPGPSPAPTPVPTPVPGPEDATRIQKLEEAFAELQKASQQDRQALIKERRQTKMQTMLQALPDERRTEVMEDYNMMNFSDDAAFDAFFTRKAASIAKEVEDILSRKFDVTLPKPTVYDPAQIKEPDLITEARKLVEPTT